MVHVFVCVWWLRRVKGCVFGEGVGGGEPQSGSLVRQWRRGSSPRDPAPPPTFCFFFWSSFFFESSFFFASSFFLCRRLRCVSSDGSSLTLTGVLIIWRRVCRHGVGGSVYGLLDGSIVLRDFGLLLEAGDFCLGWTCGGQATCVVVWWCMVVVV